MFPRSCQHINALAQYERSCQRKCDAGGGAGRGLTAVVIVMVTAQIDLAEICDYSGARACTRGGMQMSEATITCYCGSCELGLAEQAATCFFRCGCNSCRQKIQFGQAKGGREFVPLPKLFYMPSVITFIRGKEHLQAFQFQSCWMGNCRCDCEGSRPELRVGNFPRLVALELWISGRSVGIKWTSFAIAA